MCKKKSEDFKPEYKNLCKSLADKVTKEFKIGKTYDKVTKDLYLGNDKEQLGMEILDQNEEIKKLELATEMMGSKIDHLTQENEDLSTLFLQMPDDDVRMMNFMVRRMADQGVEKYGKYERNMFMDIMYQLYSNDDFANKFISFYQGTPTSTKRKIKAILDKITESDEQ